MESGIWNETLNIVRHKSIGAMSEQEVKQEELREEGEERGEGAAGESTHRGGGGSEGGGRDSGHNALCHEMFQKISEYLNGELAGVH